MDEVKIPMSTTVKSVLVSGSILGLVSIAIIVITYLTGDIYSGSSWLNWVGLAVEVVVLWYFTKKYRDEISDGFITYGKAFLYGWMAYLVAGLMSSVFSVLLQTVIEPNFLNNMMEHQYQIMLDRGMPEARIEQAMAMSKKFSTPLYSFFVGIIISAIIGLVISLITAIFVKKNRPIFE